MKEFIFSIKKNDRVEKRTHKNALYCYPLSLGTERWSGELMFAFSGLAIAQRVSFIDQNGVGVMFPTITRDLHAEDTIPQAGAASLVANTTSQMLYSQLSDIFGRRVVFLAALSCLRIATFLSGLAWNTVVGLRRIVPEEVFSFSSPSITLGMIIVDHIRCGVPRPRRYR
ncbi:hypothetical protein F5Y12DRAFT_510141 [Xylaria sp. FL1777]|nr:hypothetical protein F5Y12DRAFT_510141 [Xylaria sp. FL1777]